MSLIDEALEVPVPEAIPFAVCEVCGSLIPNDMSVLELHTNWHARLSAMYEALSKPFGGN